MCRSFFHFISLNQGSSNLILEGRCPAEFSSNLPQNTCLEVSSMPSKSLISCFRCVWLGLELNSAGHWPSRTELADPWSKLTHFCLRFKYKIKHINPMMWVLHLWYVNIMLSIVAEFSWTECRWITPECWNSRSSKSSGISWRNGS